MSALTRRNVRSVPQGPQEFAQRALNVMTDGDLRDFRTVLHPRAVNREAVMEPPAARQPCPEGFHATAMWLRGMFADLAFEIHAVAADGDLVSRARHDVRPPGW